MRWLLHGPAAAVLPYRLRAPIERHALASLALRRSLRTVRVADVPATAALIAVGDISLAFNRADPGEAAVTPTGLFDRVLPLFRSADLRVGNIESVFTTQGPAAESDGIFLQAQPAFAGALADAGFDAVTCANNHILDFGAAVAFESIETLAAAGIRSCGFGATPEAARAPALLEARGVRVGMLGYCEHFRPSPTPETIGVPALALDEDIVADIARLRAQVELLVVQLHWGWEWTMHPLLDARERARRFVEAGADVVLCHHAHVPMGLEVWKRGLIAHGLGNFFFPYRHHAHPWRNRSFVLKVHFGAQGVARAEVIPCGITPDHRVAPLTGWARREVFGAHRALARRLADDAFLARLQRDRVGREAVSLVGRIAARAADGSGSRIAVLAQSLRMPLYQGLVRQARELGDAGAELAAIIDDVLVHGAEPRRALEIAREAASDRVTLAVQAVERTAVVGGAPLGRVP